MSIAEPICGPLVGSKVIDCPLTNRVLLLGNDDRVLLAVARGLGRKGIEVHVAWCDPSSNALKSKYIFRFHVIPSFSMESDDWLKALNRLVRAERFDLVMPCNDFAVIPLQNHRDRLADETRWYLINEEAFRIAFDKAETSGLANSLEIKTPREYAINDVQIRQLAQQTEVAAIEGQRLHFPIYVKPRSSITQHDVKNKRSAQRIDTPAELAETFRKDCPADGLLIQESFAGVGVGVEVLACKGKILMQLQHRRLRETIDGGSTYRETIAEIPELSDATLKLVKRLNYTGVAMFEYRYCPDTRDWVFLEINARFWGSLPLAIASGANFPYALYEMLVLHRSEFDSSYVVGRRCRNLIKDLRAFRMQRHTKLYLWDLLLAKDHFDFMAKDDWRPQLAELGDIAKAMFAKIFWRQKN
ncbi:MAG: ATP-grasp domain-containing protein [Pirellulaceae bacterium]